MIFRKSGFWGVKNSPVHPTYKQSLIITIGFLEHQSTAIDAGFLLFK